MTSVINRQQVNQKNCTILYDASLISTPDSQIFTPAYWQTQAQVQPVSQGRGAAWFINQGEKNWVLRHYRRGGLPAKLNRDIYLGWRAAQTRAIQEWNLLVWMFERELPVPRPIAAQASWPGTKFSALYRADIIVQTIPHTQNLSDSCLVRPLDENVWQAIGRCIARFHQQGIYHSDLNASNILLNQQSDVFLIDFDKSEQRSKGGWQQQNLQRLLRSLKKFQHKHKKFNFTPENWQALYKAYQQSF